MSIDIITLTASKSYTDKQIEKASIKGGDLSKYVQSVNGVGPDERGNVELSVENVDFVVQDTAPEDISVLWVDPTDNTEDNSGSISITGAKVGQTIKIAEVDKNGVPTAWEAVEFPGEEEYELIETITFTEGNVNIINIKTEPNGTTLRLRKLFVRIDLPIVETEFSTGAMNFIVRDTGSRRVYAAYSAAVTLKPSDKYNLVCTLLCTIDGGVIEGRNNFSLSTALEHQQRNNGPIAQYIGNDTMSSITAEMANGFPIGTIAKIYGVRA